MITGLGRARAVPVDRSHDRLVALASIVTAVAFLCAAIASLALPESVRRGAWLPLHLALAGGAATAISGVLPFFVAAFAAAQPADARIRAAAVAAVALGAAGVAGTVASGAPGWLTASSGLVFIAGVLLTGIGAVRPLRGALGPGRGIVTWAYLAALAAVVVGATVATLLFAGWAPVASAWPRLRAAHAWLNLVGFVSVVIVATLIHFFPTVVGARISRSGSGRVAVLGVVAGPWTVGAGYLLALDVLVQLGAALTVAGALGLVAYAVAVWRTRGRWTTDASWHAFAIGGLWSAIAWFVAGSGTLAIRAVADGADPGGWSIRPVAGPLVAGWAGMALLASATHLVPAVGPGDQAVHARQRAMLGRWAVARLVLLDAGVAALTLGGVLERKELAWLAAVALALSAGATALLLGWSIALGISERSRGRPGRPAPG